MSVSSSEMRLRSHWVALGIIVVMYMVAMIDRTIVAMLIGPIQADLNIDDFQASLLMGTAFGVCYVLFSLPFGWAADRYPRPHVILFGMTIWSLACAAGGLTTGFAGLFVSRMFVGIGEASLSPSAYSLMAEWFPRKRLTLAMAIYHYGGSVGGALALLIGGLIAQWSATTGSIVLHFDWTIRPWQAGFLLVGLPGVLIALLALFLKEPRSQAASKAQTQQTGRRSPLLPFIAGNRLLITAHFLGFGMALIVIYGQSFWIPQFLDRRFDWDIAEIGALLALLSLVATFVGQIGSIALIGLLERKGYEDAHLRGFICVLALAAVAAILTFSAISLELAIVGIFVSYACLHPVMTYASSSLQLFTPAELRGRLSALFLSMSSLVGLGLGPAIVGFVSVYMLGGPTALSDSLLFTSIGALCLGIAALAIALKPYREAKARNIAG